MKKQILTIALLALAAIAFSVNAAEFKEGVHYERIVPAQPTSTGDKVEVLEMFWYGCPHCYRFEPYVERWLRKKPANAEFVRMPGIFRASWEPHARAYYTSVFLGVFDKVHQPLFDALHQQKRKVNSEEQLMEFFAEHGVDKIEFTKTYRSFAVEAKIQRAKAMAARYNVRGVPVVIVNGKYRVSARSAGSNSKMLKVIDYLVEQESK